MATTIRDNRVIPAALSERWELLVKEAGKRIFERRKKLIQAVGERPYRGMPTDEGEVRAFWAQIRRDPEAIMEVLADNVRVKPAGGILFPKELINGMMRAEKHMPPVSPEERLPKGREIYDETPQMDDGLDSLAPESPRFENLGGPPDEAVGDAAALESMIENEIPSDEDEPDMTQNLELF